MSKWKRISELADLIEDHSPVDADDLRAYCEDGTIPPRYAKRKPGRERGHWFYYTGALAYILQDVLEFSPEEIREVMAKASPNFRHAMVA